MSATNIKKLFSLIISLIYLELPEIFMGLTWQRFSGDIKYCEL